MDHRAACEFLARIELFRDLAAEELARVAAMVHVVEVKRRELLFEEGAPRRHLHMIEKGEVELFRRGPLGGESRLAFFEALDFLGEGSLSTTIRTRRRPGPCRTAGS